MLTFDRIERIEAEAGLDAFATSPEAVKQEFGLGSARIGGSVVLTTGNEPAGSRNTVTAVGLDQPLSSGLLEELIHFLRDSGVTRASLKVAVPALPGDAERIRQEHGLRLGTSTVKLLRPSDPVPQADTTFRVELADPREYSEIVQFAARNSMIEARHQAVMAGFLRRNDYQVFTARDGDDLVAIGVLRFPGDYADLIGTVTLPSHRRRGAQTALIAARAALAQERGVRWLLVETVLPPNSSHDNMLRLGFREAYVRQQWLWGGG